MKVSDDLFSLIQSLEKQEKRYFKLYLKKNGSGFNQNMIDLFNEIDKQKVYDEERIKKKFKTQSFIKQFHVAKNRLYQAILKSLDAYYAEASTEGKLQRLIHQAKILYEKGLQVQCKKRLDKARKLAIKDENFLYVLKILQLEVLFFDELTQVEKLKSQSLEGYQIGLKIIERYRNFMEFNMMRTKLNEFLIQKSAGGNLKIENVFNETELNLLKNEGTALSFTALQRQLVINSIYYRLKGEMQKSLFYRKRLVEIFENNPPKIIGSAKAYITGLNNLLAIQLSLKYFKEALETVYKLEGLKKGSYFKLTEQRSLDISLRTYNGKYSIYMQTNNVLKAIESLTELEQFVTENSNQIPNTYQLILSYFIAISNFFKLDYQNATSWFYELLNHPAIDTNEEIHTYSRLINLLCYSQMNNESLFESFFKSTERYLKAKKINHKYVKSIMQNLKKLHKLHEKRELDKQWHTFKTEIEQLNDIEDEQKGIHNLRLLDWIECIINKEPLHEVLNQKKLYDL